MATKTIGIKEDVYERLKTHKRNNESFSDTLERLLHDLDSDWRTHAGFLTEDEARDLEIAVERGLDDTDEALEDLGDELDEQLKHE